MRKITLLTLIICLSLFTSCSKEEISEISYAGSKWKLVEVMNKGEGGKLFEKTDQNETIEFLTNSIVKNSNSWCENSKVSIVEYTSQPNDIIVNCGEIQTITYEIDGNLLYIFPNCEDCGKKYVRITE
jgi:hypothetical protein